MISIIRSVMVTTILATGISYVIQGLKIVPGYLLPRSVSLIDGLLTLVVIAGTRFSIRIASYYPSRSSQKGKRKRILIAGAGDAGHLVAREIHSTNQLFIDLIGFVDDDPEKINKTIHSVKVLGPLNEIPRFVDEYQVEEVIIAMPTAPGEIIRKVVKACDKAGVTSKTLPGVYELLSGKVSVSRLRDVEIGDLLRRDVVQVDSRKVKELHNGRNVLVTGAGGSIGTELCNQIVSCKPKKLILLGHGENSLYILKNRLNQVGIDQSRLKYVIADIRDSTRLGILFSRFSPEIIFHTAAHKHVPLMEENVEDAVSNNIQGTWNLIQNSIEHNIERFVLISTDKSVDPVSVMGMTKRIAELIVHQGASQIGRPFVSVRFGNVLDSRGSVIPLFRQQIASGGPLTVTHPDVERYFMTIQEAVQLVLQASVLGKSGEIFLLDMGKPIKIVDLARDMIQLSGYDVDKDIKIIFTGMRPGERLTEFLSSEDELFIPTEHKKILVAKKSIVTPPDNLNQELDNLFSLTNSGNTDLIKEKLAELSVLCK
jgi:FlaA1/EpsC-like NDP-sugar epimerase